MVTIPTIEPAKLVAGDTWKWKRTDLASSYPASDSWVLSYELLNTAGKISFSATADGDNFLVTVVALTTAAYAAGTYAWNAFVTKGAERFRVGSGSLDVVADFGVVAASDTRSHARKVLDAIEAVLEGRAAKDHNSYQIDGRRLDRTPIAELLMLRDRYRREAERELAAENIDKGLASGRKILTRFGA